MCDLQSIQRRLEEIEVTFKDLEEKGVVLERSLRGEAGMSVHLLIHIQYSVLLKWSQRNCGAVEARMLPRKCHFFMYRFIVVCCAVHYV